MWPNLQFPADLVTFTEEILNGKLHFLSSEWINPFHDSGLFLFSLKITGFLMLSGAIERDQMELVNVVRLIDPKGLYHLYKKPL